MFIQKNYNPKGENKPDCLIRALTAYHGSTKTYNSIKAELVKIGKIIGYPYNSDSTIIMYCKKHNLKIYVSNDKRDHYMIRLSERYNAENVVIKTKNKRINVNNFCKYNHGKAVVCSSTHAIYVENKNHIDTHDSGRRFVTYVIRKSD